MADDTGGERSLPASAQKRLKARNQGTVARSQDLGAAISLLVALISLYALGPAMIRGMLETGRYYLAEAHTLTTSKVAFPSLMVGILIRTCWCMLPFMLVMMVSGVVANFLQVGWFVTTEPLIPKFSRVNPLAGLGRFVSARSLVELIKSLTKLALVGWIAWAALKDRTPDLLAMMMASPDDLTPDMAAILAAVWWRVALAMLVLGIADYGYQYWQYERDLRMTLQEMKEEMRELEGDPHVKARVRQLQKRFATQRMMKEVPKADVIITNPTHYAIALRYDLETMSSPQVVAKGARIIAERIRDIGLKNQVPIVQRPELARAIFRDVEIGRTIPENLFTAVAEVLSFVYQIDRRAEKIQERGAFMRSQAAPTPDKRSKRPAPLTLNTQPHQRIL